MAWTRSARSGALSLLTDKARERSLIDRCAVRRKSQARPRAPAASGAAIVLPEVLVSEVRVEVGAKPPITAPRVEAQRSGGRWPETPIARTCHDLRTPLNAVIGFTDLMRQELHGPIGDRRYAEYLEHIAISARALLEAAEGTLALVQEREGWQA